MKYISNEELDAKIIACESELMGGLDSKIRIWNAVISHTFLGIEDHGIFTFMLELHGNGSGQGFGNYELKYEKYGIKLLEDILKTVGVYDWMDLKGKFVRVISSHCKVYGLINITNDRKYLLMSDLSNSV